MVMYAQLAKQDKTKGITSIPLSYDVEKDAIEKGMTIEEYLKNVLELNPQFERVFCR